MSKIWIVILFGFCFVASSAAEEEDASRIAREMVRSLYGSERVKPLPPVANAQVRAIARRLAVESDGRFQHAFFQEDREQGAFFSGLMKHVIIGVMICLVFFVVHTVVRKLDAARRLGKTDRDVAVQGGCELRLVFWLFPCHLKRRQVALGTRLLPSGWLRGQMFFRSIFYRRIGMEVLCCLW